MHLKSILLFRQMGLLALLGEPYLAGHSLDEGIEAIEQLFLQGLQEHGQPICSTLDILGEEAKTKEDAERNILHYQNALEALGRLRVAHLPTANEHGIRSPFTASLKLSAISTSERYNGQLSIDQQALQQHLKLVLDIADLNDIPLTVDMEDHLWTEVTLELAADFWSHGRNVDIVLQSYLHRTLNVGRDFDKYIDQAYPLPREETTIRACRGIYREPKDVAVSSVKEAKVRLYYLVDRLLQAKYHVGIATHDPKLVEKIRKDILEKRNVPKTQYELQGLKGVYSFADSIMPPALAAGETVRMYMPMEMERGAGEPYMNRRVMANPGIAARFLSDRMKKAGRMMVG